jgi:hypothetical protein
MTVKNAYLANEECLNALPELVKTFDGLILSEATLLTSAVSLMIYLITAKPEMTLILFITIIGFGIWVLIFGMKIYLITLTPWPRKVITLALIPAMGPV